LQLCFLRVRISCEISANKVTKLEERLLTPPVYSLRKTHAYDELPFAEPSGAEQVLQTVTTGIVVCEFEQFFPPHCTLRHIIPDSQNFLAETPMENGY
jgi:hypothetical protein